MRVKNYNKNEIAEGDLFSILSPTAVPTTFIEQSRSLSSDAKWLFVLLCSYANCPWPSDDKLQELTGWNKAAISKAMKQLENHGWIERGE